MRTYYDVVVVGGGMVGLTMACLLGDSNLQVAVIDARMPSTTWNKDEYELRVSAITPASQKIFQTINAWSAMQAERVSQFHKMHVWDAASDGEIDFDGAALGEQTLGYIIENRVMQKALFEQLKSYSNITFICPAKLIALEITETHASLKLDNNQNLTTQLIIGADGAESKVRKLTDIEIDTQDYAHTALVATVRTEKSHQETAWQRFLPTGPLAFLPLSDPNFCSIVWSTSQQQAEALQKMPEKEFCKNLAINFAYHLGKIESASECAIFPLRMRHVKNYVQPHLALIGDAAHTIHPLAGQGVNMGIADAQCLAEIILTAHEKKRSIGALHTLRRFERERKGENLKMFAAVDSLKKLFANETMSMQWLRGVGLNTTNKIDFLKNYLMRCAMGV